MVRQFMAAALLLLLTPANTGAQTGDSKLEVVTEAQGVRVIMTVPHSTYPQNALVPVTVRIDNLSSSSVSPIPTCEDNNPGVQVLMVNGQVVYPVPNQIPTDPGHCPPGFGPSIAPGQSLERQFLVVLRGPMVRVYWSLAFATGAHADIHVVIGKPAALRLVVGQNPTAALQTTPQLSAQIQPPAGTIGPLWYIQMAKCPVANAPVAQVYYAQIWQPATTTRLEPPCSRAVEWHLAAGWIGQPITTIDYIQPDTGQPAANSVSAKVTLYRLAGHHWKQSHVLHVGDLGRFQLVVKLQRSARPASSGNLVILRTTTNSSLTPSTVPVGNKRLERVKMRRTGIGHNTWKFVVDVRFIGRSARGHMIADLSVTNGARLVFRTIRFVVM